MVVIVKSEITENSLQTYGMRRIVFKFTDKANKEHYIKCNIPSDYNINSLMEQKSKQLARKIPKKELDEYSNDILDGRNPFETRGEPLYSPKDDVINHALDYIFTTNNIHDIIKALPFIETIKDEDLKNIRGYDDNKVAEVKEKTKEILRGIKDYTPYE